MVIGGLREVGDDLGAIPRSLPGLVLLVIAPNRTRCCRCRSPRSHRRARNHGAWRIDLLQIVDPAFPLRFVRMDDVGVAENAADRQVLSRKVSRTFFASPC